MSFIDEARAVVVLANELRKVKPFLHRYKSAVKLYDNNNRMRAICDHISKQFSLTNETVFTLADKVFQCPGMDVVNHWKPVQPSVLVAPFSQCHRCTKNLTFSSTQVVVLGMEGPYHASLFKGNCTKCRMWYNVDSVAYMSEDKQKQLIEMYPLETIMSVGFLKINEQYYVTIPFADLWLKHLPSGLLVKLYREQRTYSLAFPKIKVPDPDSAVIFKRGFYVYHMLLLQQYISKIPANDDYEHMRYSHFRPSWAPNNACDSIHDIRPAMREYVTFMTDYFSKKWQHTAATAATSFTNGKEISGSVMDGKVMGHLLCSCAWNECIIFGCKRTKTDSVLHTCGLSAHNATVQEIIACADAMRELVPHIIIMLNTNFAPVVYNYHLKENDEQLMTVVYLDFPIVLTTLKKTVESFQFLTDNDLAALAGQVGFGVMYPDEKELDLDIARKLMPQFIYDRKNVNNIFKGPTAGVADQPAGSDPE
ncbi:hypothetical protein BDR26DRAFT_952315, partial [Obelidium mucronatum]